MAKGPQWGGVPPGMDDTKGEPLPNTAEDIGSDWIKGYESTPTSAADAPDYPGNQVWQGVGDSAVAYKAHWKNKPPIFPWGSNSQGGK